MTAAEGVSAGRNLRNLIVLFFGGPFIGIAVFAAATLFRGWLNNGLYALGAVIVFGYMTVLGIRLGRAVLISLGGFAVFAVFTLVLRGIVTLASGGAFEDGRSSHTYVSAQLCVTVLVIWLVIGVPYRAFRMGLDPDGEGHAKAALVGVIASAAAVLTAVNILMLHFAGGPLRSVNGTSLTVGVIFTVLVVIPVYRFVAAACWKYGIGGMFSPRRAIERWKKMLPELQAARDQAAARDIASGLESEPASQSPDEGQVAVSATSAKGPNTVTVAAAAAAKEPSRSSGRAVGGPAARRTRKKARKVGGRTRS